MGGSSKSTQQQQSTSSNTIDPAQMALYQQNYAAAQNNAAKLTPYTGQLTAGFTPAQQQAQGLLSTVATDPSYGANNAAAVNGITGVLGANNNTAVNAQGVTPNGYSASTYNPSGYGANGYDASLLSGTDLSPYLNPYTQNVINTTLTGIGQARDIANAQDQQKASAEHAFGGSRSGVDAALTNQYYGQQAANTISGLNQANYTQAQAAALNDINARNNAGQFNANAANTAGQFNAGAANTSGQFNAGAQNSAGQFNAGQDLAAQQFNSNQNLSAQQDSIANALNAGNQKLNAAGQLVAANNNGLSLATEQGGLLGSVGDAQQSQAQTQLTNAYNAYMAGQQLTVTQQNLLNAALGMIPVQQTINSSGSGTNTTSNSMGFGQILGAIAGGAKMLSSGGVG